MQFRPNQRKKKYGVFRSGGLSGVPPEAKLPSSSLQRAGYLTATTEWYVAELTLELDGSMSTRMDVAYSCGFRTAWMLPAMGCWEPSSLMLLSSEL